MASRTDLAAELHLRHQSTPSGVILQEEISHSVQIQTLQVTTPEGAAALGKPMGRYCTLTLPEEWERDPAGLMPACSLLAGQLQRLLPREGTVLVAGLGNRAITPDALGPFAAQRVAATRHLTRDLPRLFPGLRPVCVLSPGVLGTTGLETAEILGGIIDRVKPDCLLAIDALCAEDSGRLCRTVQLCDTGITPGEGAGTARCQLDPQTLGIPVVALGMPTLTDVSTLVREQTGLTAREPGWLVTRSDIDSLMDRCTELVSRAVNRALHPELTDADLALLTQA